MTKSRMKLRYPVAAVLTLVLLCAPATAQPEAMSQEDMQAAQQVCQNDVFALCQDSVPDQTRITACLRRHFREVSAPCRDFMAHYGKHRRHHRRHES
ncbi:MAG TPA: cysteine rich repeat-containing protein [Pseudolabrys sp.]|nr:cysteine rich repeat-containing protein [Pseudolabrys sp.]